MSIHKQFWDHWQSKFRKENGGNYRKSSKLVQMEDSFCTYQTNWIKLQSNISKTKEHFGNISELKYWNCYYADTIGCPSIKYSIGYFDKLLL